CSRLTVVLLHMAALAIALELGIKILVARAVSIDAVGPFGVSPLDRETAHPLPYRILDGQRIGYVMTCRAHFSAKEHCLVIALVFGRIDLLVGDVLPEDLTGIRIFLFLRQRRHKWAKPLWRPDGMG